MLNRWVEKGLLNVLGQRQVGCIVFSPLAQGLLSDRYLNGIPQDSRAAKPHGFLKQSQITEAMLARIRSLNEIARQRGQTLAQMALAWVLKDARITSALVGASSIRQIEDNVAALRAAAFSPAELDRIEDILK